MTNNTKTLIDKLRSEAKTNPVANCIFLTWALRQRARAQVTIISLQKDLDEKGFPITRDKLQAFLTFLAGLGIGTLVKSSTGKVTALVHIKQSLQSIGAAAMNGSEELKTFRQRNRFEEIPAAAAPKPLPVEIQVKKRPAAAVKMERRKDDHRGMRLTVYINNKSVSIPLDGLDDADLVQLVHTLEPVKQA